MSDSLLGAEDTAGSKMRRLPTSGDPQASVGRCTVGTTSGHGKCPEENKYEKDVLLWMVSEDLSKELAFELSQ